MGFIFVTHVNNNKGLTPQEVVEHSTRISMVGYHSLLRLQFVQDQQVLKTFYPFLIIHFQQLYRHMSHDLCVSAPYFASFTAIVITKDNLEWKKKKTSKQANS